MKPMKMGALLVMLSALVVTLVCTSDGEAQRRVRGAPFVRASSGNITINIPIQEPRADESAQARRGQLLVGSTWSCEAAQSNGGPIRVTCMAGAVSVRFERAACEDAAMELTASEMTYTLRLGCE